MKNGLLDFLQAASNSIAGNVAGPVDLLSLGLNKLGANVGPAPVGGTEWMKQRGLMRDVQPGAARVLGETAGLLAPAMMTKFAPEIAGGLLKAGDNLAAPTALNRQAGAIDPAVFGLPVNKDGTVSLYHGTTKDAAKKIVNSKRLISAGEPDVYMTTAKNAGYGDGTNVRVNVDPKKLFIDDEFPGGRFDFRMPARNGQAQVSSASIDSPLIGPRSQALDTAQKNATEMLGLPPNNTPMDRARALGFSDDVYHGTNSNVSAFDRVDGGNMWGRAHYLTDSTEDASNYATGWHNRITPTGDAGPNVMPLSARGQMFDMDAPIAKKDVDKLSKLSGVKLKDYLFDAKGSSVRQALAEQTTEGPNHWLKLAGYDGIKGAGYKTPAGGSGSIQAIFQPSNIRSRFAAFDPARIKEADLLGRANPGLLGLLGAGVGGGAYLASDK